MMTSTSLTSMPGTGSTADDGSTSPPASESQAPTSTSDDPTTSGDPTSATAESGPTPPGSACTYTCSVAADCLAGGMSYGHTCQMGKCVIPCSSDDGCVAFFSGWLIETCTQSSDCELGTCVAFEGGNGCAFTPDIGPCADIGLDEVQRMTTEGDMVSVCAEPDAICVDPGTGMECVVPCTDFVECYTRQTGEECTAVGECVYTCVGPEDCPASNFDNVTPGCG